ncbi:BatA domain-containing protein [Halosimplex aquaticum]|uniref:BatA domain-containing protein n=1 Tax=Halosimplex aquaticum TaxID=3026162 RepID=A0ABD5XXR5_9EURY|nr:BatA and WFA domain-containing protein [Halosimplex aquaticum]
MALSDVFLAPIGLAAALVAIPIVVLYLIRPDPDRVELPTLRFLADEQRQRATTPLFERISRSLLLLIQILAVLLLAGSLAAPYVPVEERAVVEETVLVVDTSASMATTADGQTRLDRALAAADEEVTTRTSVVTTSGGGQVVLRRGPPSAARETLRGLEPTAAPGDLRGAIAQARALADEGVRVVVLSDFAGDEWRDAVTSLRARGLSVTLRQFDGGGEGNVGFVDRRFSQSEVTLSVKNFGSEPVTRTVRLGDRAEEVDLAAGDVGTVTFPVPAGTSEARLSPGDGFATDDVVPVAAPEDPTVDVLVLTNDRNRYLTTALSLLEQVDLTVQNPPTTVKNQYDVIVYSNVDADSLLPGNVEAGRTVLAEGGGVAVQAQKELPDRLSDLLLLDPDGGTGTSPTIRSTAETELTEGIDFQPPDEYLTGSLRSGEALVELRDGTPLLATDRRDAGRLLYYGYMEERSSFKYNYQYPVFWKRAVFHLAGREPLAALNHKTGDTVRFGVDRVEGPSGRLAGPAVTLREVGLYRTEGGVRSAALLDERESAVDVEPLSERSGATGNVTREETRTVPQRITEFAALAALLVAVLEIGYLRRRGEL